MTQRHTALASALATALLALTLHACNATTDGIPDLPAENSDQNGTGVNNGGENNGDPNNGDPNNGDPNNAVPNNADPNNSDPNNNTGNTNNAGPNNGDPNNGSTNNATNNNNANPNNNNNADPNNANPNNTNNNNANSNNNNPPYTGPTRYPHDALVSPITASVVASMEDIRGAAAGPDDMVFMKVGASGTVSNNLLDCFAGGGSYVVDLNGREELRETIDFFLMGDAAGATPFDRETVAAVVGRSASWAIAGDPSPLDQETDAINPRYALINYGTNDMGQGSTFASALLPFHENMSQLIEMVIAQGIIPIISGLNPRAAEHAASAWVPTYNAVTRGLAEAYQVPYIDLYLANIDLADRGLVGDGVHGNVYRSGGAQPCVFTDEALGFNYNRRNLLTLQVLDVVRRTVLESAEPPDVVTSGIEGDGSPDAPFVIDALPFAHTADTSASGHSNLDGYPSCDTGQDESGPEYLYALELDRETKLRVLLLDRGDVDIDLHILGADGTADSCVARHDRLIETTLAAGSYTIALDTFVSSGGGARAGEYLLAVIACEPGDTDCD